MMRFALTLLGRWSSRRRALVAGALTAVGVVAAILTGLALDQLRIAAAVGLIVLVLGVGYVAILAARGLRARSEYQDRAEPPIRNEGLRVFLLPKTEHHDLLDTAATRRARALATLATEPWVARRAFEVAAHARSGMALELLAAAATSGRFHAERVIQALAAAPGVEEARSIVGVIDGDSGALLARWLMGSSRSDAQEAGVMLARLLVNDAINRGVGDATRLRLAHGLALRGHHDAARAWMQRLDPHHLEVRLLGLDRARAQNALSAPAWGAAVAALFEEAGLERVEVDATAATPFDALHATAPPVDHEDDDPLITVIMSCFEPDDSILSAARSIVEQTWARWELLVMDDGSTGAEEVLERVAALDPRIRVVRSARNAGTYVRRNEAITVARGSLITAHDSDDWAHPRRLELQARHLKQNPRMLANVSESLRVGVDLSFAQPRASGLRLTEATIMFRAEPVVAMIGYYDAVRRAADSEFRLRLEAVTGERLPIIRLGAPLTLVRSRADSLSGRDFRDQWMHPARVAYRSAMTQWSRERREAGLDVRIDHPQGERPFPAHRHLTGERGELPRLDLLVVGDTRASSAFGRGHLADLVGRAVAHGLQVGVRRLEDIGRGSARDATAPALQRLISAGDVVEVIATDTIMARTVLVAGDRCLLGVGEFDTPIVASSVRVIAEAKPSIRAALLSDILPQVVDGAPGPPLDVDWATALDGLFEINSAD